MKMGDFWIRRAGGPDLPRRYGRQTKRSNHWMVCILREKIFFSFPFQLPRGAMVWSKERQEVVKNIRVVAGHIRGKCRKVQKNTEKSPAPTAGAPAAAGAADPQQLAKLTHTHDYLTAPSTWLHQGHDCRIFEKRSIYPLFIFAYLY